MGFDVYETLSGFGLGKFFYEVNLGVASSKPLHPIKIGYLEITPLNEDFREISYKGVPIGITSREGTFISKDRLEEIAEEKFEAIEDIFNGLGEALKRSTFPKLDDVF